MLCFISGSYRRSPLVRVCYLVRHDMLVVRAVPKGTNREASSRHCLHDYAI